MNHELIIKLATIAAIAAPILVVILTIFRVIEKNQNKDKNTSETIIEIVKTFFGYVFTAGETILTICIKISTFLITAFIVGLLMTKFISWVL